MNMFESQEFNKDKARLDELIQRRLINVRSHPTLPYKIYNYSKDVQLGNKWEFWTELCRGLVLDLDGNIIARPFAKFFNWDQGLNRGLLNKKALVAMEKLDGSLGIVYFPPNATPNDVMITTKGNFESEQAKKATEMIRAYPQEVLDELFEVDKTYTAMFEIIYPENRIVVNYGMQERLVLIGFVQKSNGGYLPPWPGMLDAFERPKMISNISPAELFEKHQYPNEEGYVLFYQGNHLAKLKFDDYILLHRMVTGYTKRTMIEKLQQDWFWEPDEEIPNYELVERDRREFVDQANEIIEECIQIAEQNRNMRRKEFAQKIAEPHQHRDLLFLAYDCDNRNEAERRLRDQILKTWKKRLKDE